MCKTCEKPELHSRGEKLKIWASFNIFHDVIKTTSNDKLKRGIRSVMVMNRFKGTRGRTSSGD